METAKAAPGGELEKSFKALEENQKKIIIFEMLDRIDFGVVTIKKHNKKISAYSFNGEFLFRLDEPKKEEPKKP